MINFMARVIAGGVITIALIGLAITNLSYEVALLFGLGVLLYVLGRERD